VDCGEWFGSAGRQKSEAQEISPGPGSVCFPNENP
jgi:hypothetical protein